MRKALALMMALIFVAPVLGGCGAEAGDKPGGDGASGTHFNPQEFITVVSREDGSGTRGAFIELFGIEEKRPDGGRTDRTTPEAIVANKTDVMLTHVAGDPYAIGYVSLGSLNDSVKAVAINGVAATADNIKSGSYEIARPFIIATKGQPAGLAKDFIDFILSAEGQAIVEDSGYIRVKDHPAAFSGAKPEGKIVVAGSSSVTPVMDKLKEAYLAINPHATIEIQLSDSTTGLQAVMNGTADIGMASRDLKESEAAALSGVEIALDGIAVIVNKVNPVSDLTKDQVRDVFTGEVTDWSVLVSK